MRKNYKKLGPYIQEVKVRNTDLAVDRLLGVSVKKVFIPSVANTVGTNFRRYKIVKKNQFTYIPDTSRRGDKIGLAFLEEYENALVSQAYTVFKVVDESKLLPEYLMMWFRRPEFDRYARYKSHGSVREIFGWDEMCEVELPIPSIEKQQEIVNEYNTVVNRIKLNEQLNQKLEETAQALYKHWFVDFEFPNEDGKPYKSSGGAMVYNEELDQEIPEGWSVGQMDDIVELTKERISVNDLTTENYITTTNMIPNRGGVLTAESLPSVMTVTKFEEKDILISNIRPYFKKIWFANFKGGCSNDVLCFKTKIDFEPLFAYYIMESEDFFDYVMQGAKGTKMPRGDKKWIMKYPIVLPGVSTMKEFKKKVINLQKSLVNSKDENELLFQLSSLLLSKMTRVEEEKTEIV